MMKLVPDGTYRRILGPAFQQFIGQGTKSALDLPVKNLLKESGLDSKEPDRLAPGTLRQVMAIIDPAFEERQRRTETILFDGLTEIVSSEEPGLREALAEAYARKFDANQLGEIAKFFATPTGAAYAATSFTIRADPAVLARMKAMLPRIAQAMPVLLGKAAAATADLPRARDFESLTPAEKDKLSHIVGVTPTKSKKNAV